MVAFLCLNLFLKLFSFSPFLQPPYIATPTNLAAWFVVFMPSERWPWQCFLTSCAFNWAPGMRSMIEVMKPNSNVHSAMWLNTLGASAGDVAARPRVDFEQHPTSSSSSLTHEAQAKPRSCLFGDNHKRRSA